MTDNDLWQLKRRLEREQSGIKAQQAKFLLLVVIAFGVVLMIVK